MPEIPFFLDWIKRGKWYDCFLKKRKGSLSTRNTSPVVRKIGKPMIFYPASRVSERNW